LRGGWDADSDERNEGCPGGVDGTGDTGQKCLRRFLSGATAISIQPLGLCLEFEKGPLPWEKARPSGLA